VTFHFGISSLFIHNPHIWKGWAHFGVAETASTCYDIYDAYAALAIAPWNFCRRLPVPNFWPFYTALPAYNYKMCSHSIFCTSCLAKTFLPHAIEIGCRQFEDSALEMRVEHVSWIVACIRVRKILTWSSPAKSLCLSSSLSVPLSLFLSLSLSFSWPLALSFLVLMWVSYMATWATKVLPGQTQPHLEPEPEPQPYWQENCKIIASTDHWTLPTLDTWSPLLPHAIYQLGNSHANRIYMVCQDQPTSRQSDSPILSSLSVISRFDCVQHTQPNW